ncbi:hypothetical protein SCRM01_054 [Synechococcus phage S-CRM01]|uniref:hypothetical protein n=1 Tax=Synechococcus phage S-CRM01 TaxID=1026955 RepID=UPI000209E360|nr:hypothetical protein SCRM01_054 [Synechococcus phage S-CRM01]AEC53001.1 hypothetical protein SCRM01_054 [Synechococcus phage S-CRM01]
MLETNIIPDNTDYKKLYLELIYLVQCKWPGETRHETAARYIQQAENQNNSSQLPTMSPDEPPFYTPLSSQ